MWVMTSLGRVPHAFGFRYGGALPSRRYVDKRLWHPPPAVKTPHFWRFCCNYRAPSFFSTLLFSRVTYLGKPPSTGALTSPSINGRAYSTNLSFGRKPSSLIQSRGTKCSTLAMSDRGCKSVVQFAEPSGLLTRTILTMSPLCPCTAARTAASPAANALFESVWLAQCSAARWA